MRASTLSPDSPLARALITLFVHSVVCAAPSSLHSDPACSSAGCWRCIFCARWYGQRPQTAKERRRPSVQATQSWRLDTLWEGPVTSGRTRRYALMYRRACLVDEGGARRADGAGDYYTSADPICCGQRGVGKAAPAAGDAWVGCGGSTKTRARRTAAVRLPALPSAWPADVKHSLLLHRQDAHPLAFRQSRMRRSSLACVRRPLCRTRHRAYCALVPADAPPHIRL